MTYRMINIQTMNIQIISISNELIIVIQNKERCAFSLIYLNMCFFVLKALIMLHLHVSKMYQYREIPFDLYRYFT